MRRLTHAELAAARVTIQTAQGNRCAICEVSFTDAKLKGNKLVPKYVATLDHDHDTGQLRGVLCSNCNGNEGRIKRRAQSAKRSGTYLEWLEKLVAYLKSHQENNQALLHPTHKSEDEKREARNKKARQRRARAKAAAILATTGK